MQSGVLFSQDNLKHTYLTDSSESLPGSVDLRGGDLHQYLERLSLQRLKQATLFPPVSEQRPVSINFLPVTTCCSAASTWCWKRASRSLLWLVFCMNMHGPHDSAPAVLSSCCLPICFWQTSDVQRIKHVQGFVATSLGVVRAGAEGSASPLHRSAGIV